jgi:hypothetical protein
LAHAYICLNTACDATYRPVAAAISLPLLLRLFQPNILEPVVDIKAVVASFVVEIRLVAVELFDRFSLGLGPQRINRVVRSQRAADEFLIEGPDGNGVEGLAADVAQQACYILVELSRWVLPQGDR